MNARCLQIRSIEQYNNGDNRMEQLHRFKQICEMKNETLRVDNAEMPLPLRLTANINIVIHMTDLLLTFGGS